MTDGIRPILLVEDNPIDLDLSRRAFLRKRIPNPIQVARDGEEALNYLQRWENGEIPPLLILLDLKLPKVDGLEVLRQVKSHARYRMIPVVVLTTSSEDRDVQAAYQLGANSYIVKPIDYHRFMEVASQLETYWCQLNQTVR